MNKYSYSSIMHAVWIAVVMIIVFSFPEEYATKLEITAMIGAAALCAIAMVVLQDSWDK